MKWILLILLVGLTHLTNAGNYKDNAVADVKRHMLLELYDLMEIDKTIISYEKKAFMPALKDVEGWGKAERKCIMNRAHGMLRSPIFRTLLNESPSELLAENIVFYNTAFGKKVNKQVIHGKGHEQLTAEEQKLLIANDPVMTFISLLNTTIQKAIFDNMQYALEPGILECTKSP